MNERNLAPVFLRYGAYSAALFGWLVSLPLITRAGGIEAFREGRFVEWFQFGIVALAAGLLAAGAWRLRGWRELLLVLAALAAAAAVREQDALLDRLLIGWKIPAGLCLAIGVAVAARNLPAFGRQVREFVGTPGFGLFWAGTLTVVGAAQLIGHGDLLQIIMADAYDRDVKRVVEEAFESFGYLILLAASIETLVHARRVSRLGGRPEVPQAGPERHEQPAAREPAVAGHASRRPL